LGSAAKEVCSDSPKPLLAQLVNSKQLNTINEIDKR
jgi:hypothetical protein